MNNIYATLTVIAALDDSEFEIACSANPELEMICNGNFKPGHQKQFNHLTDFLYKTRCEFYFDKSLLKFQEGIYWKEFYERLTYLYANINKWYIANEMAKYGKLIELKILAKINKFPDQWGTNLALSNGHLYVLEWTKENNLPRPDEWGANSAAENGHLNILQWMKENNLPFPDLDGANWASLNGQLNVLQWMKENNLPLPNQLGANWAAQYGNLNVLKWMKENNLPLPDQSGVNLAAEKGHLNILQWMKENNLPFPGQYGANWAAQKGHLNILQWMKENNLPLPDQIGAIRQL